ncbi:SDR family NAD(P)-dependent oxidoreductase [Bacillus shivajii]|uniref:SDR family NAD(P)-dependent oxidoreductase n=1 Tax=Bacillus shivajii TaxID=1983719 RepID=UPI001CFB40AE|nr:SDR family NAD(P)-dependent oxidoreductase [Bacillus shivajii]UCZ55007.1 SDR family NAD(P)-dependent oxidoreductase [Bacillus shivajii]
MHDRVVIITGARSGIGKAAALRFATEGYTVVMACRNMEVSKKVQDEIIATSKNENVDLMELDVSSFKSIDHFCDKFKKRYEKLDILIHNAAYVEHGAKHRLSIDGIELTFATNVVGPYLMTHLLLNHLKKSDDARIFHAGSNIIKHFFDPKKKIEFETLQGENKDPKFSVYNMYRQSKIAFMMLTFKMADEFKNEGIKVNALQINGAKLSKETLNKFTLRWRIIGRIQSIFLRPTEYMANNYYDICTSDKFKETTGKLFNDKLEMMETATGETLGFIGEIKQVVGTSVYPAYADDKITKEKVWDFCDRWTEKYTS